jgi:hypothetical protein
LPPDKFFHNIHFSAYLFWSVLLSPGFTLLSLLVPCAFDEMPRGIKHTRKLGAAARRALGC